MPSFSAISRRYIPYIVSSKKSKFCKQGGKLDYSRYSLFYIFEEALYMCSITYALTFSTSSHNKSFNVGV